MQRVRMTDDDGGGDFLGRVGYLGGALNHTGWTAYEKLGVLGWKLLWLLDCQNVGHGLVYRLAGGDMITQTATGRPDGFVSGKVLHQSPFPPLRQ
jgi:hypothetical protein